MTGVLPPNSSLAHLALEYSSTVYAVTDDALTVIEASKTDWIGQSLPSVVSALAGMESVLYAIAREELGPLVFPYVTVLDDRGEQHGYFSYHVSTYPPTQGVFVVVREDTAMAVLLQEVNQQHNEMALLREALEKRTRELEEANNALQARDQERHRLISLINHDSRTPLATIINSMEFFLKTLGGDLSAEQREVVELGMQAAQSARELADMILQVERTHRAQSLLTPDGVNLGSLLREVVQRHLPAARRKQITLVSTSAPGLSVWGDWQLLREAISNIVENGVKYTPPEGEVRVRAWSEGEHCFIEVSDNGPGIPTQDVPHLFKPFREGRNLAKRRTGLGLYIAHKIITMHKGTLWADSEEGKGTRILVRLPRHPSKRNLF